MVLGFECEFMVTLGEDLIPIEDDPFHVQDVEHAVSAVTPVIEVRHTKSMLRTLAASHPTYLLGCFRLLALVLSMMAACMPSR